MWKRVLLLIVTIVVIPVAGFYFSVVATGNWLNWFVLECSLFLVLYKSSSDFSEQVSAEKYTDYQKHVPKFVPFIKFEK